MKRDFDDIILCIPALSFLVLNILHFASTFFILTNNTAMLLTVATPIVIMELIAVLPIIASVVFVIIFRSEILAEIMTILFVGLFIYQAYVFWVNILPIMVSYLPVA